MLEASARRIEELVGDGLVLDVGGWADPFARADWVIDLQPYASRGFDRPPPEPERERFSADTWVVRDICAREPWPFEDGRFDFAVCAHTLEDVRDPIGVCDELVRVARAGYIEVPSRLVEQSWAVQGEWVGYSHHTWLCEVSEAGIEFVRKHHAVHGYESNFLPAGFADSLSADERVEQLWWDGSFGRRERVFNGPAAFDHYLRDFVTRTLAQRPPPPSRGRLSRLLRR